MSESLTLTHLQAVSFEQPDQGDLDAGGRGWRDLLSDAQGPLRLFELLRPLAPNKLGVFGVDGQHAQQQLPDLVPVDAGQGEPGKSYHREVCRAEIVHLRQKLCILSLSIGFSHNKISNDFFSSTPRKPIFS